MTRSDPPRPVHYLSFDIEDWFHVPFAAPYLRRTDWDRKVSIVESGTQSILELLYRHGVKATFFVLGLAAARHPGLIREIAEAGHEIGIHGNDHIPIAEVSRTCFREDVRAALSAVGGTTGVHPMGYRAPLCSIDSETLWALDVLRDEGLRYDSSVYPSSPLAYAGMGDVPSEPYEIIERFYEVPLSCETVFGIPLPLSGGFYLRLAPLPIFSWLLARRSKRAESAVLYYHPWEFSIEYPRVIRHPLKRFIQYHSLRSVRPKLEHLLSTFRFRPLREALPTGSPESPVAFSG